MEGLNKLTLKPIELRSPNSTTLFEEPPPGLVLEPILIYSAHSHTKSTDSGYFLRSRTNGTSGGLGKNPVATVRGRGRVSHLAMAQSRAKKDVMEGK